jgi:hypothetical protein
VVFTAQEPDTPEEPPLPEPFLNLIKKVFNGDINEGDIDDHTAIRMAENFTEAIKEGLQAAAAEGYDYTAKDAKLFEALQKSAYRFSAAKSWQVNKQLTELLANSDGSFSKFEQAAIKELQLTVGRYGRVEWNSSKSAAQMSAKWERFKENADIMPYLMFSTTEAESVCPICAPFDKLTRPINDPVWNHASPLLHFQCQCTLLQLPGSHEAITPDDQLPNDELVPKLFRVNYAEKMQAFPPDHPYYDEAPKKSLNAWVKKNLPS